MRSYSETDVFTERERGLLLKAQFCVEALPDRQGLRCHEVARAVGRALGLPVQDGKYGSVDHTWLWTSPLDPQAGERPNILDVYVVGRLPQVQLVHYTGILPEWNAYKRTLFRGDIDHALVETLVSTIKQAVAER